VSLYAIESEDKLVFYFFFDVNIYKETENEIETSKKEEEKKSKLEDIFIFFIRTTPNSRLVQCDYLFLKYINSLIMQKNPTIQFKS